MMQAGEMLETHFKSYASIGFKSFVMQDIKSISWENTYTLVTGFDGSVSCNMVITFMIQMNDKGLTSKIRNRLVFYIGLFFENPIWLIYTWYQSMNTKVVCVLYCFQRLLWLHHKLLCKASHFLAHLVSRLLWLSAQLHKSLLCLNMISEPGGDTRAAIECVWAIATVYFTPH